MAARRNLRAEEPMSLQAWAYVWVMFAVCVRGAPEDHQISEKTKFPKLLFPWNEKVTENQREKQPWRGLFPFFQHGNIAEPTVYESIKKELACKTLRMLKEYLDPVIHLENGQNLEISFENHENHEKNRIPLENHENHEILEFHLKILNIMKS